MGDQATVQAAPATNAPPDEIIIHFNDSDELYMRNFAVAAGAQFLATAVSGSKLVPETKKLSFVIVGMFGGTYGCTIKARDARTDVDGGLVVNGVLYVSDDYMNKLPHDVFPVRLYFGNRVNPRGRHIIYWHRSAIDHANLRHKYERAILMPA